MLENEADSLFDIVEEVGLVCAELQGILKLSGHHDVAVLEVSHGVVELEDVVLFVRKAAKSLVQHIVWRLLDHSHPTLHDAEL